MRNQERLRSVSKYEFRPGGAQSQDATGCWPEQPALGRAPSSGEQRMRGVPSRLEVGGANGTRHGTRGHACQRAKADLHHRSGSTGDPHHRQGVNDCPNSRGGGAKAEGPFSESGGVLQGREGAPIKGTYKGIDASSSAVEEASARLVVDSISSSTHPGTPLQARPPLFPRTWPVTAQRPGVMCAARFGLPEASQSKPEPQEGHQERGGLRLGCGSVMTRYYRNNSSHTWGGR